MSRSCGDIRTELIDCVRESQCMKTGLRDFHKCMKSPDELDKDCVVLRQGYGDCRRGWVLFQFIKICKILINIKSINIL